MDELQRTAPKACRYALRLHQKGVSPRQPTEGESAGNFFSNAMNLITAHEVGWIEAEVAAWLVPESPVAARF